MSAERVTIMVNGEMMAVAEGVTVAGALLNASVVAFRSSVSGEMRAPLCGMGVCYECRVTIDGMPHRRSCLAIVSDGMRIETGAGA